MKQITENFQSNDYRPVTQARKELLNSMNRVLKKLKRK